LHHPTPLKRQNQRFFTFHVVVADCGVGRLEEALAKYLLAEELSGGQDEQIRMDAERVEKVH